MGKCFNIGKIILGVALCVCLTGCGSKETKLVCKQSVSGVDITFNVNFKGNKVEAMDVLYNMDLSSYSDTQIGLIEKQDFCSTVKSAMGTYKDGFENCKQKIADKVLKVTADLNVDKFSNSATDTIGSPKETKKSLEKQGYSCTIE